MKYKRRNYNFTKLTIRIDEEELNKLKEISYNRGYSVNNQINFLIRDFLHQNRSFFDNNICQNMTESDTKGASSAS